MADLGDDHAIGFAMKADRLDMRTDHAPLAGPVLADSLAAMDMPGLVLIEGLALTG